MGEKASRQSRERYGVILFVCIIVYFLFFKSSSSSSSYLKKSTSNSNDNMEHDSTTDDYHDNDNDNALSKKKKLKSEQGEEGEESIMKVNKKEKPNKLGPGAVHPSDKVILVSPFTVQLAAPMVFQKNMAIAPNVGGGGKNLQATRGFVEVRFKVKKAGVYWLYVETFAPTILDNSLWVSPPLDPETGNELDAEDLQLKSFFKCDSKHLGGPLIPHKHLNSAKKLECCPKYLSKNAKKGMSSFYSDCCYAKVGPYLDGNGCVFDLEVDTAKPLWNLSPRPYQVTDPSRLLVIRLYGREDGTGVAKLFLSENDELKTPK